VLPLHSCTKTEPNCAFFGDHREVNKSLPRILLPIPKVSTVLQELEGFTYATALDLNMDNYTIRLDPASSKTCNVIFTWGKHSYLRLPIGIACSADIFQAMMSKLMVAIEFVQACINDLLCITKDSLDDHLMKLRQVLIRL